MATMNQKAQKPLHNPPLAEKRPVRDVHHGVERIDDYAWLRVNNWQEVMRNPAALSSDVRAYLEAENAYTADVMADTGVVPETLFKEVKGRIKEDDSTEPSPGGAYAYFTTYVTGGAHPHHGPAAEARGARTSF